MNPDGKYYLRWKRILTAGFKGTANGKKNKGTKRLKMVEVGSKTKTNTYNVIFHLEFVSLLLCLELSSLLTTKLIVGS